MRWLPTRFLGNLFLYASASAVATQHKFTIKLRSASGDLLDWKMYGETPAQVLLNARELCPECEVVKIEREGEW